jgi:hypothetical protein
MRRPGNLYARSDLQERSQTGPIWRLALIRSTELELHARAQTLFESENPGRLWRVPTGSQIAAVVSDRTANMTERQTYLARVRILMRQEGVFLEVDEFPAQPGARR